ncbi:MAG TPA: alkaline phosphatase PhoX [Gemmatimonadales bacterium]|jgi:hypothetical protein
MPIGSVTRSLACVAALTLAASCADNNLPSAGDSGDELVETGMPFQEALHSDGLPFDPLATSASCVAGGSVEQVVLPTGFVATPIAKEGPGFLDLSDMNTVNETGRRKGRFLYRTHELGSNGGVSVTDLVTGESRILAQRADFERFDGIAWTPWGTIIAAEESSPSAQKDPGFPDAVGGHVYEFDPETGEARTLAAVGARAHEGLRFDKRGNLYGISERSPGYIYRFVPDHWGDLTSGDLYVLKLVEDLGDRTGWGEWVKLDRDAVKVNSDAAADAAVATGYARPEDVEIGTSTGTDRRGDHILYVAITGENRVLAIDLKAGWQAGGHEGQVFVSDYVRAAVNAPADFTFPDNLALDKAGNLYITEDPGGSAAGGKTLGDDVWAAPFNPGSSTQSLPAERFLSITDCDAEPTGIYFSPTGRTLFVNIQHRGGADPRDLALAIKRLSSIDFLKASVASESR